MNDAVVVHTKSFTLSYEKSQITRIDRVIERPLERWTMGEQCVRLRSNYPMNMKTTSPNQNNSHEKAMPDSDSVMRKTRMTVYNAWPGLLSASHESKAC